MVRRKKKDKSLISAIFVLLCIITITLYENNINLSSAFRNFTNVEKLEVSSDLDILFLDVGQADAILIRNKGKNTLIDAGNNEDGKKLVSYFDSLGIDSFEYVIGTHAHEDHIGGLDDIIESFNINTFYMPDALTTTKTFEEVLDALDSKGYYFETPKIDSSFKMEDCIFEVLYVGDDEKELNNSSIVLLMKYGNQRFLFTGDAEEKTEEAILHKDIKADVLKVGHHGSEYSTSDEFLEKVNPRYAIIEVGQNNTYKHPKKEILDKLEKRNITIYRTDEDGTIHLKSDGKTINIETLETDTNG